MTKDYEALKDFWNNVFVMEEEEEEGGEVDFQVKDMAPCEKLYKAAVSLGTKQKTLDYGCGSGWAAMAIAENGCKDVTAVEIVENAAKMTETYVKAFHMENAIKTLHIDDAWLGKEEAEAYDGIICSNVIDVLPEEIANDILANLSRVAKKDASVMISMNYYQDVKDESNYIYVNDVLRMVSRTDEEWAAILGNYFTVEAVEHFAWPGEETERRRLFVLKK